jgi:single-strand DNA-binding protein
MWNKLAEIVEKYVRKGKQLYIEGKIRTRTYGEGENKKYFTEIIADQMTMLGSKNDSNNGSQLSSGSATEVPMPSSAPTDDLPF